MQIPPASVAAGDMFYLYGLHKVICVELAHISHYFIVDCGGVEAACGQEFDDCGRQDG